MLYNMVRHWFRDKSRSRNYLPYINTQQTLNIEPMLAWCWASVVDRGPTLLQHCLFFVGHRLGTVYPSLVQYVGPWPSIETTLGESLSFSKVWPLALTYFCRMSISMLVQWWANAYDIGPALKLHRARVCPGLSCPYIKPALDECLLLFVILSVHRLVWPVEVDYRNTYNM